MPGAHRLLILADDFTGACDASAACAALRETLVVHRLPDQWPAEADDGDLEARAGAGEVEVLGVDLDLRERSNAEAEALTRDAARRLCANQPGVRVFLKIDSTLRGPLAGLAAGALAGSGRQIAVIAPAFPEQGRLLVQGRLVVDGRLGASLPQLLGDQPALLAASAVRSAEDVEVAVENARSLGSRLVVVDADGADCLNSIASAWQHHTEDWLLVGSAGLARQVANVMTTASETTAADNRDPLSKTNSHPVLVVAGSPAPATQAQIQILGRLGPIVRIESGSPVPQRPPGDHTVLVLCTPPAGDANRDAGERAAIVAATVAAWAAELTPAALVLAGGATARLVCERLGANGVHLQGELEPGIPYGTMQGGQWNGVRVVTKAGGFGKPATLLDVVNALGVSSVAEHP